MILKSCDRQPQPRLGPAAARQRASSSKTARRRETKTYVYAGYKEKPRQSWEKGTEPKPIGWYAGKQYDDDVANAKKVLADLDKYYPGATGYEVAGFLWWQGDKDRYNAGTPRAVREESRPAHQALRKDFNAPNAKFVCATLGQTEQGRRHGQRQD
jgi:hypothetical protein